MEREFEREVLHRLDVIETKLDPIVTNCRDCQRIINQHSVEIAKDSASSKSAHHRIDGIYKAAGIVATIVSTIIGALFMILNYMLKASGHG